MSVSFHGPAHTAVHEVLRELRPRAAGASCATCGSTTRGSCWWRFRSCSTPFRRYICVYICIYMYRERERERATGQTALIHNWSNQVHTKLVKLSRCMVSVGPNPRRLSRSSPALASAPVARPPQLRSTSIMQPAAPASTDTICQHVHAAAHRARRTPGRTCPLLVFEER